VHATASVSATFATSPRPRTPPVGEGDDGRGKGRGHALTCSACSVLRDELSRFYQVPLLVCVCVHAHTHVCTHEYMYVYVCVCVCVCVCKTFDTINQNKFYTAGVSSLNQVLLNQVLAEILPVRREPVRHMRRATPASGTDFLEFAAAAQPCGRWYPCRRCAPPVAVVSQGRCAPLRSDLPLPNCCDTVSSLLTLLGLLCQCCVCCVCCACCVAFVLLCLLYGISFAVEVLAVWRLFCCVCCMAFLLLSKCCSFTAAFMQRPPYPCGRYRPLRPLSLLQ